MAGGNPAVGLCSQPKGNPTMAEAKQIERFKSAVEARKAYEALAKQCTELASRMPKIEQEIRARVLAEKGDAQKKLAELMAQKRAAAAEMYAAEERERAGEQAKQQAAEAAKAEQALKAQAEANAQRIKEQQARDRKRASEAVQLR
jgi:hypothetical protein